MNTTQAGFQGTARKATLLTGILYITATLAGILSLAVTGPIREAQDQLGYISANERQAVMGALLVLVMGLALAMIPVLIFPLLKRHNETLALGYVVFRSGLEACIYLAIAVSWLFLIPLSQAYAASGTSDSLGFQALGAWLLEAEEISSVLAVVFPLGALMFYSLLYRSRLVPRWLSGWGLVAIIPYMAAGLAVMFGIIDPLSTVAVVSDFPLALQEMVLAVWLIVKGFNSYPVNFEGSKVVLNPV